LYLIDIAWQALNNITGAMGSASVSFAVRGFPVGGACVSVPASGFAINTTFELSCTDWSGVTESKPFTYR